MDHFLLLRPERIAPEYSLRLTTIAAAAILAWVVWTLWNLIGI